MTDPSTTDTTDTTDTTAATSPPVRNMDLQRASGISSWHAHVYFDSATRDLAWSLRETIERELVGRMTMGRFHEKPVGPHPMWSYQLAISTFDFADVTAWLAIHHGALDVFIHPNTDDALRDHRDCALWLGHSHQLNLEGFGR